ncbi:MAG: gamma carbonic anhydrase family protein [Elusimicrobia bacterium RIFCSPHIGHO2_01_FULL_64_10]|nr:MAG: gamma carbonic anhydrase family protein [Elusimicrobia bacterium RIFCSPHIGHO2_01_FULL_64_10]
MIREWQGHRPRIHPGAFVHESAEVIGQVTLEKDASVWPYAVLRGDVAGIVIGEGTNIQDNTVIHANPGQPAILGPGISVGHSAVLHGCTLQGHTIIGMGAIVLDGAVVEEDCIVGAGAVVSPRTRIPKGSMALGVPARVARPLKPEELEHIRWNAREYLALSESHRKTSRRVF